MEVAHAARFLAGTRPDVVHLQWSLAPPLDGALVRAMRSRVAPVVYTAHNVVPHEARPWHAAFHSWLQASADRVIVHSAATRRRVVVLGGAPPERIDVVPMPADEPGCVISRDEARAALTPALGAASPVVLFIGHVRPYKGLELLLDAVPALRSAVPDVRLVVAGAVRGGALAERRLSADVRARGLEDVVGLRLGLLAREDFDRLLWASTVVVLPYRSEGDSAVLAAARGRGRAVVATEVGGLADALEAGGGILVRPGDPAMLASALANVLLHAGLRHRLEREARTAAQSWTWRDAARRTLEIYRTVVERAPVRASDPAGRPR
jgi:glycosyltransferase involved in cell wall biosynthesis